MATLQHLVGPGEAVGMHLLAARGSEATAFAHRISHLYILGMLFGHAEYAYSFAG